MRFKKLISVGFLLSSLLLINSCVTKSLWQKTYPETFQNFSVSRDGSRVALVGAKYHYVFTDNSGILRSLLTWQERGLLFIDVSKTRLKVDLDNDVYGYATIESFTNQLRPEQFLFLTSMGFKNKDGSALFLKLPLQGKRYLPRNDLQVFLPRLSRPYVVDVNYEQGILKKAGNVALTPLTVTADSVLLLGKIILFPFSSN